MAHSRLSSCLPLALIITGHLLFGAAYAILTPTWQVPDEPAHFNYVQHVAAHGNLPVLQNGDFPYEYLEQIKAARFPRDMPVTPIRYESWQPPLYYSIAALLLRDARSLPTEDQVVILRLFSVLLAAGSLLLIHRIVSSLTPGDKGLPLYAVGFAATIPMHLALSAGVSNDALAELLLLAVLWQSIEAVQRGVNLSRSVLLGILLGLVLLTKTTVYVAIPVAVAALYLAPCVSGSDEPCMGHKLRSLLHIGTIALLFGMPWFLRNAQVYGGLDLLAWQRHDSVVTGQLRTAELLQQVGLRGYLTQFVVISFHSFWAQFGWMGVLIDARLYQALALFSGLLVLGFGIRATRVVLTLRQAYSGPWRPISRLHSGMYSVLHHLKHDAGRLPRRDLILLAWSALLTLGLYLGYNTKFVQFQGRYLFPAMAAWAWGAAVGLQELLRPRTARPTALVLAACGSIMLVMGTLGFGFSVWSVLLVAGSGLAVALGSRLSQRWPHLAPGLLYLGLLTLDWLCLWRFVVPALQG